MAGAPRSAGRHPVSTGRYRPRSLASYWCGCGARVVPVGRMCWNDDVTDRRLSPMYGVQARTSILRPSLGKGTP